MLLPLSIGSWFDEVIDNFFTLKAYISDQYLLIEENWSTAFYIYVKYKNQAMKNWLWRVEVMDQVRDKPWSTRRLP